METTETIKKPIQLRIIFILNALMMFLPFIFYYVFKVKEITIEGLDPMWFIYTGIAYILSFAILVPSILKRNIILFRTIFLVNILIAIPAGAYIGIGIAIISMILSFNKKVISFFKSNDKF